MIISNNMKIISIKNPNYEVTETAQEIINILKKNSTPIFVSDVVVGLLDNSCSFYVLDGAIFGSLRSQVSLDDYEWYNAEVKVHGQDHKMLMVSAIHYRKKDIL